MVLDATCPAKAAQAVTPPATPQSPTLQLTFLLDPGTRSATDSCGAVQHFILELDHLKLPERADNWIVSPAAISGKRLAATLSVSPTWLMDNTTPMISIIHNSAHIGFAYESRASANLPIALLQFESDSDTTRLKSFQATCP
jgi:hypothetical protein